ncbi:MAG: zinc metalloprotease HtpX [Dehalococcoidia bacterium]|nr:zinc metalloprotease HtpX [Dehalococcoidia bacterium]MSQ35006.1 zinc metalloprotease HtpX [Dehalococcoidia bacterium]
MPLQFKRDRELVMRMYLTMFLLGVLYAFFALVMNVGLGVGMVPIAIIVGVMVFVQYMISDKLIIWSSGAKVVTAEQEPELHAMVDRLAHNAGMVKPKVAIIQSPVPNAFATGRNPKNSIVAVTTGIRERLTPRELEGVLGHELAHVRNKDMRVLAIANFLVTMTSFIMTMLFWSMLFGGMRREKENNGGAMMLLYLITVVVYFIGQLLVLALTRYREYGADHSGAEISGDPGALASALEKISGAMARIPEKDLRKLQTASAFLLIPPHFKGDDMVHLFSTHPRVEDRIRRLRELEQRARFGVQ